MSVHLNIAEAASRKSEAERKRFFEISRGSLIDIDAAIDIANELGYLKGTDIEVLGKAMVACFRLLSGLLTSSIKSTN